MLKRKPTNKPRIVKTSIPEGQNGVLAFNPARAICSHLVGANHTATHRMIVGFAIMASGVFVSKLGEGLIMHFLSDMIGYGIHGVGLLPVAEKIVEWVKN